MAILLIGFLALVCLAAVMACGVLFAIGSQVELLPGSEAETEDLRDRRKAARGAPEAPQRHLRALLLRRLLGDDLK